MDHPTDESPWTKLGDAIEELKAALLQAFAELLERPLTALNDLLLKLCGEEK